MAQLAASIVTYDEEFKRQVSQLLRAGGVPVAIIDGRVGDSSGAGPDVVVVDIRADASSGMAAIERLRASQPSVAIFAIAATAEPERILQAMRAGSNEFFQGPPAGATQSSRVSAPAAQVHATSSASDQGRLVPAASSATGVQGAVARSSVA